MARLDTQLSKGDCGRSAGKAPALRPSKNGRWRALALILVHVLVALHVAHWMATGSTLSPLEPSEAMEFSKHDLVNAGFVFFGLTILSTLVLGRWFCGWACHLVALQDLCLWLLKRVGIRPRPLRSRLLALVPALAALYMFAYPLLYRLKQGVELGPVKVALTKTDFWATFPPWPVALATFAVCGFVSVYFLGAKGFCTYACPYGALFGLADRFAPGRIRVTDACEGCGHCTATCTSNVIVHEEVAKFGMVVDQGCMKCLDCVSVCPKGALYFGFGKPAGRLAKQSGQKAKPGVGWGEELLLAALFLASFLIYRGLYGVIPFLLALGLSGVLAFLFTTLVRVLRRPSMSFLGRALRRESRLTGAGRAFTTSLAAVALLSVHSALIQFHT
ncbi:MAG: 4Fe-4S binding protein, partial [Planctomycetes bacterium]|nr:4Fe-4S binding protein [Planctomycetota bacterium]